MFAERDPSEENHFSTNDLMSLGSKEGEWGLHRHDANPLGQNRRMRTEGSEAADVVVVRLCVHWSVNAGYIMNDGMVAGAW